MSYTEEIIEEAKVRDLQPDKKPDLTLVMDDHAIDRILSTLGITYDPQEEYPIGSLWVSVEDGEYVEAWGCTYSIPYLTHDVFRLR